MGEAMAMLTMTFAELRHCALLLILLSACMLLVAGDTVAQTEEPLVRVGIGPDDQSAPFLYAAKAGLYKKAGLNVQIVKLAGASTIAAALAGGALEIGKGSSLNAVTAIAKGLPFTVIGNLAYYNTSNPNIALLVGADSPIRSPRDLEGKTLAAVSLQDMNAVATFAWLDRHGVDRNALRYVEIQASAFLAALEANRVVASTIYEPFFSADMATGKVRVLGYPYEAIGQHFSTALIITRKDWVGAHRDDIGRFLRATQDAVSYLAVHPEISTQVTAEFGGLDPATMPQIRHATLGVPLSPTDIQPVIDVAAKYKLIPRTFPASEIICSCALRKK